MGRSRIRKKKEAERDDNGDENQDHERQNSRTRASSRSRINRRSRSGSTGSGASKGGKSNNPVIRYFQETADELRKVKWPEREETIRLTLICLAATAVSTLILGGLDFIAQEVVVFALQVVSG